MKITKIMKTMTTSQMTKSIRRILHFNRKGKQDEKTRIKKRPLFKGNHQRTL